MSTTPEKKSSETLGVKEAMQHYVSTLEAIDEPATTIKKLTKQALDPDGNCEGIQKARTIAQIWKAAAIDRGYDPVTAIVGEAVVGTSEI